MSQSSKRLSILLDSEINELYSPPSLTPEQSRHYFSLNDIELESFNRLQDRYSRVYFVLLLGYFKIKPVILNFTFSQVKNDFKFVASEYFPGEKFKQRNLDPSQKTRLYRRVFSLVDYKSFSNDVRISLQKEATQITTVSIESRYILDECIAYLSRNKIAIPKYSILQRVISTAVNNEKSRIHKLINKKLSDNLSRFLKSLFTNDAPLHLSEVRQSAKNFTPGEINKELNIFNHLKPHMDNITELLDTLKLSLKNTEYYASLVDYYTVTKLQRFDHLTWQLYLLCYLQSRYRNINEHLADAFIYHSRKLREKAKDYAKEAAFNEWNNASENISKAAGILRLFIDNSMDSKQSFSKIKNKAFKLISPDDIESLCLYLTDEKRSIDYYVWEYYDQQSEWITETLRPLFLSLEFQSSETTQVLVTQILKSQKDFLEHAELKKSDCQLIKPSKQPYLLQGDEVNMSRFEILIYLLIQTKLNGQLFIPNTLKYRHLSDDLVNDKDWGNKSKLIKSSQLKRLLMQPIQLMTSLEKELVDKIEHVGSRIQSGDNKTVVMRSRSGNTKWRLPYKGVGSILNNPFFERLKQVHVSDLLRFVDQEIGFLNAFEHVRNPQTNNTSINNNLIASLVANGTNYGLYRMAHISDRSYEQLRQTQANYIRLETLNHANDIISNAIAKLPIFEHYNIQDSALHASVDGQKFECRMNTFKTRYSSKYFGTNKGVSAMTLVANHVPINARVIGANEHESHFIFDLLFNNTSEIKPDVLSTDTHGANHVNFALLDLFGYTFAPRYAQFSRVIEELFTIDNHDNKSLLTLKKPIKFSLIIKEWETIQRIAISLQKKTTTQAAIVRKLSTYSKKHPLLQALTEYDRLIKSMYILEYIDDASLRSYVQRALNRGEAYHQLRRTVASVNGNRFRGGSDGEIDLWNECARLLTNAIIYFNSLILSRLLGHYDHQKDIKHLELVKQVSPVAWININLNGTYSFSFGENMLNMDEVISPLTDE